jgi:hypothetical protein
MATTTGPAIPNYSQSFSPAYGNPLIAALRANSPAPARQASGIEDISTGKYSIRLAALAALAALELTALAVRLAALELRALAALELAARLAAPSSLKSLHLSLPFLRIIG